MVSGQSSLSNLKSWSSIIRNSFYFILLFIIIIIVIIILFYFILFYFILFYFSFNLILKIVL